MYSLLMWELRGGKTEEAKKSEDEAGHLCFSVGFRVQGSSKSTDLGTRWVKSSQSSRAALILDRKRLASGQNSPQINK